MYLHFFPKSYKILLVYSQCPVSENIHIKVVTCCYYIASRTNQTKVLSQFKVPTQKISLVTVSINVNCVIYLDAQNIYSYVVVFCKPSFQSVSRIVCSWHIFVLVMKKQIKSSRQYSVYDLSVLHKWCLKLWKLSIKIPLHMYAN